MLPKVTQYIRLTAPGITLLVMLTGFVGMWTASRGTPAASAPAALFLWGLLGIGLASSGASVLNNYYDRDIDRLMSRTMRRPLPSGNINAQAALVFGLCLTAAAGIVLFLFVNALSALLALSATFIYSFIYTVLLKRRTPLATEIGGLSGALPPLIGWAAVKGTVAPEALLLFAVLLFWQPPHFWSLALRHREDYRNAAIPTMSVKRSADEINRRSLVYVSALLFVGIAVYATGLAGRLYLSLSLAAGVVYVSLYLLALFGKRDLNRLLFSYSIIYLSLTFAFLAFDLQK
jgi:protoheme IX farnesyltransferase